MVVNVVSFSGAGGAGNVAKTLAQGFLKIGYEVNLVLATKGNLHSKPFERPVLTMYAGADNYFLRKASWKTLVSLNRDRYSALEGSLPSADLTIFRWMNGILGESFLKRNPNLHNLVWGLDDMNPFTGVCHYSAKCKGFETGCTTCPALRRPFEGMAAKNLRRKIQFSERFKPRYVAPTEWILNEFKSSILGENRESVKILNPLQSKFFEGRRIESSKPRELRLLIIAADLDDPTKGVWNAVASLSKIMQDQAFSLTMIGRFSKKLASRLPGAKFLGHLDSMSIIEVMRQNDVLLVPSLFENAGTVVAEAASQGLPTIARRVGGMPEMTNYGETGYLFSDNYQLEQLLSSVTKTEIAEKGHLALEWSQELRPEKIAARYAQCFLG